MRRFLSIAAIAAAGTIGIFATATSAGAQAKPDVDAVLECIILDGNGGYVAVFGYVNQEPTAVSVPVGKDNKFSPKPDGRGQPTSFAPGRHQNVVKVESRGSALTWHLPGTNATANKNSRQCAAPPVPTGNDSPQAVVLIGAAAGVIVVGGGASSWWISRRKRRAA